MTARRWRIAGVAVAVLTLVLAWFAVVSPTLQTASALDVETASQQAASQQLRSRISLLKKQSEELPAQEAKLASIQQRMPATAALPTLIRNLTTVADNANVIVASVTPGRPAAVAPPAPPPPPPAEGDEDDTDAAETEDVSADAGADVTGAASGVPTPQLQALTLNITACGTYAQLRTYLRELEQMKRVVAVSSLSVSKGSCGEGSAEDDLTATIGAHVFSLPNPTPAEPPTADAGATKGDQP